TALVTLKGGWVIVGSLPTKNGQSATAQAGCLLVLDSSGNPVETISGPLINGPWDMTASDAGSSATLLVANVLNGTVVRIGLSNLTGDPPTVTSETTIGSGFPAHPDPAALEVGPTGLGLGNDGTLYVADSAGNRIAAITDPLTRMTATGGKTV